MSDAVKPRTDLVALVATMQGRIEELERALKANRDIEALLQDSEERFRQVTDIIDEVFWMTDPRKAAMLFISKAYERVAPARASSSGRCRSSRASTRFDRDAVIASFPRQTEGTYDIEYRIVRSDGAIRWIRDKAFPVRDASGEIYRVVGVAQDITENKDLIRDLNEEKGRTERLLENILPKAIIGTLKGQEDKSVEQPAIAQRIDHATVLFADIVGFTAFSQSLEA